MLRIKTLIRRCEARSGGATSAGAGQHECCSELAGAACKLRGPWLGSFKPAAAKLPTPNICLPWHMALPFLALQRGARAARTCATSTSSTCPSTPQVEPQAGCFSQAGLCANTALRLVQGCRLALQGVDELIHSSASALPGILLRATRESALGCRCRSPSSRRQGGEGSAVTTRHRHCGGPV